MTGTDTARLQVRLTEAEDKICSLLFAVDKLEDVVYDLNQKIVYLENLVERKLE
jgi:hypothetical protein